MKAINIGDLCTHCGEDTGPGSGRFVNRIPSETSWQITEISEKDFCVAVDGWMCTDCQAIPCDECGEPTTEWEVDEQRGWLCSECYEPQENDEDV